MKIYSIIFKKIILAVFLFLPIFTNAQQAGPSPYTDQRNPISNINLPTRTTPQPLPATPPPSVPNDTRTWEQLSPTEQQYREAANCEALGIPQNQCGSSGSGGQAPGGTSGSGGQAPRQSAVSGGGNQTIQIPNPLGNVKTFGELINRLVNWLLIIGAPILTLMIIIGAFQIMTGAGEPEKITKGRHTITYAIIGYALLLISTGITKIIADVLSKR